LPRATVSSIAALLIAVALSSTLPSFPQNLLLPQSAARAQSGGKPAADHTQFSPSAADLSGVWLERQTLNNLSAKEPPFQPWAEARYRAAKPGYGPHATPDSQDPILSCYPPGVPRIMLIPFPMQIVQIPGQVMMVFEYDHFVRIVALDRQKHPKDLSPTWMGDSIGHWEGGTLVVDTVGLNDRTWLDQVGHPHSEALHVVERIRRPDHDTLIDDITIDDPKAYAQPWTGQQVFGLKHGWHLLEYICEDNMADPGR
jgi:hypothetical protein